MPHTITKYAALTRRGELMAYLTQWQTLKIDPRGHFTMLRCSFILCLVKVMARCRHLGKPLMQFCEFAANYPTW